MSYITVEEDEGWTIDVSREGAQITVEWRTDLAEDMEEAKTLFKELEFMSRDARWYGYPVALALAHESCKLSHEDLGLAREVCRDVRFEMGFGSDKTEPLRVDYNL